MPFPAMGGLVALIRLLVSTFSDEFLTEGLSGEFHRDGDRQRQRISKKSAGKKISPVTSFAKQNGKPAAANGNNKFQSPKFGNKSNNKNFSGQKNSKDLLRTRYASMLWHYGSRKEEEKTQSDDEAPMRPRMEIGITKDTKVHDI
ncbi:hypothetical protein BC332_06758 [Capsicum chinense]|nr:hypothetical protein BC332_06758 [Capsicum chinense]